MSGGPSSPTSTVNFFSPQAILAPDLAVQQQQIERQRALAMALQQQALEPIDPGKGAISWTQGTAKLMQALAAALMNRRQDKQQVALNSAFSNRAQGKNDDGTPKVAGMQPPPPTGLMTMGADGSTAQAVPSGTPDASPAPSSFGTSSPDMGNLGPVPQGASTGAQAFPDLTGGNTPSALPQAATAPPQSMPPQGASAPQMPPQNGFGDIVGNVPGLSPIQNIMDYGADPSAHFGRLATANMPADFTKLLTQSGIDPNSPLGRQIMQAQLAKQNYIAPPTVRGGGYSQDPTTGQWSYHPAFEQDQMPLYDENHNIVGVRTADGAIKSIRELNAAKSGGTEAGKAPYDMVTVTLPDGSTRSIPKSFVPGIGGTPGSPPAPGKPSAGGGAPAGNGTGGTGLGGVGVPTGMGPARSSAASTSGSQSAKAFQSAIDAGTNANNSMALIDQMVTAANGVNGGQPLPTGHGAGIISEVKSGINSVVGATGTNWRPFDPDAIARFDEIRKNAAALGSQLASAASGANGTTDARLNNALAQLPNENYSPKAFQQVAIIQKGLAAGALARSQAAAQWQQSRGAENFAGFQQDWNKVYSPDIFFYRQQGPDAFKQWVRGLSATARARVTQQYAGMARMGAFAQ